MRRRQGGPWFPFAILLISRDRPVCRADPPRVTFLTVPLGIREILYHTFPAFARLCIRPLSAPGRNVKGDLCPLLKSRLWEGMNRQGGTDGDAMPPSLSFLLPRFVFPGILILRAEHRAARAEKGIG